MRITVLAGDDDIVFTHQWYVGSINENATAGSTVHLMSPIRVVGHDTLTTGQVAYKLPDDIAFSYAFKINETTAEITTTQPLTNLTGAFHKRIHLYIKATLSHTPSSYTFAMLDILLQEENLNPPVFNVRRVDITAVESKIVNSILITTVAQDPDVNTILTYKFYNADSPDCDDFSVDRHTGAVRLTGHLYYERMRRYNLTIIANDSVHTSAMTVIVNVIPVNNHDPVFSQSEYNFVGYRKPDLFIGKVQVTDKDLDARITLKIELYKNIFTINSSGHLHTVSRPDDIQFGTYKFYVTAVDNQHPTRQSNALVNVHFGRQGTPPTATEIHPLLMAMFSVVALGLLSIFAKLALYGYGRYQQKQHKQRERNVALRRRRRVKRVTRPRLRSAESFEGPSDDEDIDEVVQRVVAPSSPSEVEMILARQDRHTRARMRRMESGITDEEESTLSSETKSNIAFDYESVGGSEDGLSSDFPPSLKVGLQRSTSLFGDSITKKAPKSKKRVHRIHKQQARKNKHLTIDNKIQVRIEEANK